MNYLTAYVGPGPGLTMFWAFLALIGTILLAVLSLLLWPIRMLMRRIKGTPPDKEQSSTENGPQSADPTTRTH